MKTTIVVPCFNEEKRLNAKAFEDFVRADASCSFLFVNDGSRDGTAALLAELCQRRPDQLRWMSLEKNSGKAEAVRRGMLEAFGTGATYVGFWDADLSTPLEEIPLFVAVLESKPDCDLVMGARVRLLGLEIERRPTRHYLGRVFATVASQVLRLPVYDTQCGAKLFRSTPEGPALFAEQFCTRWIFDVEILARMIVARGSLPKNAVRELPVRRWIDVPGSKVKPKDFLRAIREMWTIRQRYFGRRRKSSP
jgi:glycosyltransferase involved in cell wall biosynthesis